jgi:hypothetical protein
MTDEIIKNLGPLAPLAGIWEGDKGNDTAPSQDLGTKITPFRERFTFEPLGPVNNHQQALYGLRYNRTVWPLGESDPFHEDLGYFLWDGQAKQALRCFIVPRGVAVIAGGTVEPDARSFELAADAGSQTYGICSNQFLDREFKTVRYVLKMTIHNDQSFSYEENTQLQIKDQKDLFHHIDKNTLKRTA